MGFESLLGNDELKKTLSQSIARGHISHFYLIDGPKGSGKHTLARLLAAAILCEGRDKPCLHCIPCRKVTEGLHPDFITIDDPEHVHISIDTIREARDDMFVRPNESAWKIYLLPRAQDMQAPAQNALLKILEEPPDYGVYILLTDNAEAMLPTIRSRSTPLHLHSLPESVFFPRMREDFPNADEEALRAVFLRSGGFLGQAAELLSEQDDSQTNEFAAVLVSRDSLRLMQLLVPMERMKRNDLISRLKQWLLLLEEALTCRCGAPAMSENIRKVSTARSAAELAELTELFKKLIDYAQGNVSAAAICGRLEWALQ